MSDKEEYPTFARTRGTDFNVATAVLRLLKHYGWRKVTIVRDEFSYTGANWTPLTEEIKRVSYSSELSAVLLSSLHSLVTTSEDMHQIKI